MMRGVRTFALTAAALVGFAANSLLTRAALGSASLDPASFALVRLVAGAVTLAALVRLRDRSPTHYGSWVSAAALGVYIVPFTLAYGRINASVGALVLFGAVQVTMIGAGLMRGERPARVDWLGVALALGGLLVFAVPGVTAPDPTGMALMAIAGVCWGVYSLVGRAAPDPLAATAGNFIRATVAGVLFVAVSGSSRHITSRGVLLATASGSLASGIAYTLWYAALPALAAWHAAVLQLIVPVLTAISAALLLHETITSRLVLATTLVLLGVLLTIVPRWHQR
jgi:drug/metabolite transporter (DMT)-like permease